MWRKALFLAAVLGAAPAVHAQVSLLESTYLDKLQGMWLGELIGNYAGAPREGYTARGGLYYQVNWTDPAHIDPLTGSSDYVFRDSPWYGDDDTCFEYLYSNLLMTNPNPTAAQVGQAWMNDIAYPSFYIANRQAGWALQQGFGSPASGSMQRNYAWSAIDSQITTESLGAQAPGMMQRAADLAGTFGSVTNTGFALQAAQYYAAMYSQAAIESDVEGIVAAGQKVVPTTSLTWQVIQDVRTWYTADKADGNLDWRATQSLIFDKYFLGAYYQGRYCGWTESAVNTAMTTLAILYGGGDLQKTIEIGVQAGFDADCNPATAAGLVGMIQGYSNLPANLVALASTSFQNNVWITGVPAEANLSTIAANMLAVGESQVLLEGGSITGTGAGRMIQIPVTKLAPLLEKPDPAGPKGLVGQIQALGGHVTVSASVAQFDPTNDQANLLTIIDGITDVSYNGHRAYSTYDGANAQPAGGDFYQLNFDRLLCFNSVIYYEGDYQTGNPNGLPDPNSSSAMGGWFTDLTVEVGQGGSFVPVTGLQFSEPLDPLKFYQVITLSFDPVEGNAIRIRGTAGGVDEFTTCLELEAYGFVPGAAGNQWTRAAGNWGDANCWTAGVPNGALEVVVGNGGVVQIDQPGLSCDVLTLGSLFKESGSVQMTGGRLDSNWVHVGAGGVGNFTQSGGSHVIHCGLTIGRDSNAVGIYSLTDGNLIVTGGISIGGSSTSGGGAGTLNVAGGVVQVQGPVKVWAGGSLLLSGGALVAGGDDPNLKVNVQNAGLLSVTAGTVTLGDVTSLGDGLTGTTTIAEGATLIVSNIWQDTIEVEGTLVLWGDGADAAGPEAGSQSTAATDPDQDGLAAQASSPVPEPATVALLALAAAAALAKRRRRS